MKQREGRPSDQEVGAQQSTRTTTNRTTTSAFTHESGVSTPSHRRWDHGHRRTVTSLACDALVWTTWFALVAAAILAMCALLWAAS